MTYKKFYLFIASILLIVLVDSIYIQDQRQISITTQFGKVVKQNVESGLKIKLPLIQDVKFFDKRLRSIKFNMSEQSEVVAFDQKTMQLDAYGIYRIIDPMLFYESVQNDLAFSVRINSITESSIREVIGRVNFKEILGNRRNEIRANIIDLVNRDTKNFGVEVADVRIIRVNLPDRARNAVYARMRSEREKEAKEIRAVGNQESQIIRSKAEKDKEVIIADAKRDAEIIKGEGESEAIKIYAEAYNQDKEFFEFYKTLEVYRTSLSKNSKLIFSTENKFLKYLIKD